MPACCSAIHVHAAHSLWPLAFRWCMVLLFVGWVGGCASLPANAGRTPSTAFNQPDSTPLGQLVLSRRTQAQARSDSAFALLEDVETALQSRIALIDEASRSL